MCNERKRVKKKGTKMKIIVTKFLFLAGFETLLKKAVTTL